MLHAAILLPLLPVNIEIPLSHATPVDRTGTLLNCKITNPPQKPSTPMDCTNTNHSSDPQTLSMISTQTEPLSIYYTGLQVCIK